MLKKVNLSPDKQKLIVYALLIMVTLSVYGQVHHYDFINVNDDDYLTNNSHVQSGLTFNGLLWAFNSVHAGFWHPLTWISLMFDSQMYGLDAGGYHITNLILHVLSALLLFWLFNRMTGVIWKGAFVAAFFALHPFHVESVAWIAERKDVLSAFFWMLSLCLYVYYTEKPDIRRYLLVIFSFACALMSKSMVVTLPVVMILLDYWPLGRFQANKGHLILWQLREKISFFILSIVASMAQLHIWDAPSAKEIFSFGSRLANASIVFVTYLESIFYPHDIYLFRPFNLQHPGGQLLGALLLICVISILAVIMMKRLPHLLVGWFWYAITILPVIGITSNGVYWMNEHYTYLPSIGIGIILGFGIPVLFSGRRVLKIFLFASAVTFLIMLSILTWQKCGHWKDSITYLQHDVKVSESNYLSFNNLGCALAAKGRIKEAIDNFNKAIQVAPDLYLPYYNRGLAYSELREYHRAIEDYDQTIQRKPDCARAYISRGVAYAGLRQYEQAVKEFTMTLRLKADDTDAYHNRSLAYFKQGKNELGCRDAHQACELGNCNSLDLAKNMGLCVR